MEISLILFPETLKGHLETAPSAAWNSQRPPRSSPCLPLPFPLLLCPPFLLDPKFSLSLSRVPLPVSHLGAPAWAPRSSWSPSRELYKHLANEYMTNPGNRGRNSPHQNTLASCRPLLQGKPGGIFHSHCMPSLSLRLFSPPGIRCLSLSPVPPTAPRAPVTPGCLN